MRTHVRPSRLLSLGFVIAGAAVFVSSALTTSVSAAGTGPGLGTAESFAVLAGAGVTNTGPTEIIGDLGTCPTPAITGFPPGEVQGQVHANDGVACGAQSDTTIAYNDAAGRAPTRTFAGPTDLGGLTLTDGVYKSPSSFSITNTLTLDGAGNPDATFIFQAGSTVITATNSTVALTNGAQACNVFWQVGSSATLGVGSDFVGTLLVLTDISANTGADVAGRLLARNGAVTLDTNDIIRPTCATSSSTSSSSTSSSSTSSTSAPTSTTAAPTSTTVAPPTSTTAAPTSTTVAPTSTTVAPTSTTTAPTSTTVAPTSTTTTTVAASPTTTTTAAASATTTTPTPGATSTTTGSAAGTGGAQRPGPQAGGDGQPVTTLRQAGRATTLPRTGGLPGWALFIGLTAVTLGLALNRAGRRPSQDVS